MKRLGQLACLVLAPLIMGGQNTEHIQLPNKSASLRLPMEVRTNGPYVEVKANGRGPFVFEVDTGSMTSPLASELAGDLGLKETDATNNGSVQIGIADGLSLSMPLDFASFAGLWPLTGRRIYGDLGYSILKHFVVEFDYERGYLSLYDPDRYEYSGNGTVFPASLEMGYRLTQDQRSELSSTAQSRSLPAGYVFRAKLILMLAEGASFNTIKGQLQTSAPTIIRWKHRFLERGLDGLDTYHPGQQATVLTPTLRSRILSATRKKPSDGSTQV